jgi:predicted alpha/beta hydrolase family esterase
MKVIIFHGTDCTPDSKFYWYAWLKQQLEEHGHEVSVPHYPEINHEPIDTFLPKVLKSHNFDNDTVLVGHSAGSPLILSTLENLASAVRQCVLVAGYSMRLPGESLDPVLQESYDWVKIQQNSKEFVFINSVNDPWGCDDKQGRMLFDKLGGTQIIRNDGHFGSESNNLPYTEFPLVRDLILESAA